MSCFEEFLPSKLPDGGMFMKEKQLFTELTQNPTLGFIDNIAKQVESTKSIEIIHNNIESYICQDMPPEQQDKFINLFLSQESCLNSQARL